jgi:hypothetical protein
MKTFAVLLVVCCIGAVSARELKESSSPPSYPTVAGALSAAANAPTLSTLLAAVGVSSPPAVAIPRTGSRNLMGIS